MLRRTVVVGSAIALSLAPAPAAAGGPLPTRIALDHSLGPPGAAIDVLPSGHGFEHRIASSAGARSGTNLFHSFSVFDVGAGDVAHFTQDTPGSISNLVARVTGGDPSRIAGTLKSSVPGADVTLLNPAGVLFTPGARVDVPAGFHVSTAQRLRMADGGVFSALPLQGEMLSAAAPVAFGFLGPSAAGISIEGASLVTSNGPLSVVAGDVTLSKGAKVQTLGGDVSLFSVASAGEAPRDARALVLERFDGLGPIAISDASVSAFGLPLTPRVRIEGGDVQIRGRTTSVQASGFATDPEGGIRVTADRLEVADSALLKTGNAGPEKLPGILVGAREVVLSGGGSLDTRTETAAGAGDVSVRASESLTVSGRTATNQLAGLTAFSTGSGDAGTVRVETGRLLLADDAIVSARTSGGGAPGDARGSAGRVDVSADEIRVTDGARIEVQTATSGRGRAGTIHLRARDRVSLEGEGTTEELRGSTGLFATTKDEEGREILVETPELDVSNGAWIDAGTAEGHRGQAGSVRLEVERLVLHEGVVTATSLGSGRAGTVVVQARDSVRLEGGSIESRSLGGGPGGLISVQAPLLSIDAAVLDTGAAQRFLHLPSGGSSGRVELQVDDLVMRNAALVAAGVRGSEIGGDIEILARHSVDLEGSGDPTRIQAGTDGDGPAGRIHVETPSLRLGEFSRIETATTGESGVLDDGTPVIRRGRAGDISIVADRVEIGPRAEISSNARGNPVHEGPGGSVRLDVGTLELEGSGQVRAGTETGGAGGSVVIRASRAVRARVGAGGNVDSISSATGTSRGEGAGDGGAVRIETPILVLEDGATVGATSRGSGRAGSVSVEAGRIVLARGGHIASDALGAGDAGPVEVHAATSLVADGSDANGPSGVFSRTAGSARGARVDVSAGDVSLRDGAEISASSAGTGDAGDVKVVAADDVLAQRAVISTSAPLANGGNIEVRAGDRVQLVASRIAADVGDGRGGNVLVAPSVLLLQEGSAITAMAGAGQGGVIRIVAELVVRSQDSLVSASAGAHGIDGTVRFETPEDDFVAPLQTLPAQFVDAVVLFGQRCAARQGATASLVVDGREPAGPAPEGLLPVAPEGVVSGEGGTRWSVLLEPTPSPGRWLPHCGAAAADRGSA